MTNTFIHLIIAILICFWARTMDAQSSTSMDSLSLESVIEQARLQALPAYKALVDRRQSALDYKIFQANRRPQFSLSGNLPNYIRSFRETVQEDGSILFNPIAYNNSFLSAYVSQAVPATGGYLFVQSDLQRYDDFNLDIISYNGIPFRIGLFQPISAYNPLRWEQRIAPLKLAESEKQFVYDVEAVSVEVLQFYFNMLLAQMEAQIANANLEGNQALYTIAEERFGLGKVSENDLLQLKLELIGAQKAQIEAAQSVRLAQADLGTYLGIATDQLFVRAPDLAEIQAISVEKALAEAFANRPESLQYQRRQAEAAEAVARARAENGFRMNLQASFGFARGSAHLGDIYQSPQPEQALSLGISIPIVDWGRRKAGVEIAQLQQSYEARVIQQEQAILEASIRQLVAYLNQLQASIELAKETQQIALRRFEISKDRYLLGNISTTDLTIAIRAKDQARRDYLQTLQAFWLAHHNLRLLTLYDFEQNEKISYSHL